MPDIEILNLKQFATLDVLSKLEGLWLNRELELIYAVACRITWICPMTFDSFPLDVQVLLVLPFPVRERERERERGREGESERARE